MKKILSLLLVLIVSVIILISQKSGLATNGVRLYFSPEESQIETGQEITLDLLLSTSEKIYSFDLQIRYPEDKLYLVEIQTQNSLVNNWVRQTKQKAGEVRLTGGIQQGFAGPGKIAQLKLKALKEGKAKINFTNDSLVINKNQENVLYQTSEANLNITPSVIISPTGLPPKIEEKTIKLTTILFLLVPIIGVLLGLGIYLYRKKQTSYSSPLSP